MGPLSGSRVLQNSLSVTSVASFPGNVAIGDVSPTRKRGSKVVRQFVLPDSPEFGPENARILANSRQESV
jgi:hypothetical protein